MTHDPRPFDRVFQFHVVNGQFNLLRLPSAYRGWLTRLVITNLGNTLGYGYAVYTSKRVTGTDASSQSESYVDYGQNPLEGVEGFDVSLGSRNDASFRILRGDVAPGSRVAEHLGIRLSYVNQDNSIGREPSTRDTSLYLSVFPGGTGNNTFEVAWTIES